MFHIMVVEDDTELRDLFCAVLTERGYQPLPAAVCLHQAEAHDGEAGVDS